MSLRARGGDRGGNGEWGLAELIGSILLSTVCFLLLGRDSPPKPTVKLNGQAFTLPPGFEIELAAGPPLTQRPIVADFDDQGRLYVAESSGTNEPVAVQLQKKPHRILRLEDTDGDGKFDKSTVFADKMMFPEGTMWHNGSLYVAAPPSIWKLTDTDGDGKADQRVEWFQGKTLTGCANDLHGPYLGPDGWIYWCKGAFAQQTHRLPTGKDFVTRASHIFRARPDGSGIEPVMTGGMDNPVDTVFTPGGERIFTTTFLVHPGGGQRDGLIHAIYGGINGKDHNVIYDPAHKWTGPELMPVMTHLGPAVPSGLVRFESDGLGKEYRDNLFTALFNLHKVTRHVLTPRGGTFTSRDEDFVVSNNLDFHPTDVLEDADGSLLIVDTGGWYKLCCPSSQLHKPDVPGAIYRVRRKGAPKVADPRGLKLNWKGMSPAQLRKLLEDPRPVVRRRAMAAMAASADALRSINLALKPAESVETRRNAVWAAVQSSHGFARAIVRSGLEDAEETVRQAAIHGVSVWRDKKAVPTLIELLRNDSAHNRRAAAEALGRLGDRQAIPALLAALAEPRNGDRVLNHSLTYALIEIGDEKIARELDSSNPAVRRAVLTTLDQRDGSNLDAKTVAGFLTATDDALRETAWWIAGRHPDWGEALAGYFRERLTAKQTPAQREELLGRLAKFAQARPIQEMLAARLRDASTEERRLVLRAMTQANLKEAPATWLAGLSVVLGQKELVRDAIGTLRGLRLPKSQTADVVKALLPIAGDEKAEAEVRLAAMEAMPGGMAEVSDTQLKLLLANLGSEQSVAARSLAAGALSRARLKTDQLLALADSLKAVGPMELERVLEAFARSTDERVGLAALDALKDSSARSSLRVEVLKQHLGKYPVPVQKQAEELYGLLDADAAKQKSRLEQMLGSLKAGDIRRGQQVFHSQKTACATCHAIGYLGGKIGPDLTRIGTIRSERDLLEAIVFPSASLVRSYEPILVTTADGKTHNGLVKQETPDEIVLQTTADQQVRIARKDIEQIQPGKVSVMPSGLDQQLSAQDLADLVAFLRACK